MEVDMVCRSPRSRLLPSSGYVLYSLLVFECSFWYFATCQRRVELKFVRSRRSVLLAVVHASSRSCVHDSVRGCVPQEKNES
ncbi:hypothetical protein K466DRAFT_200392 [Polyporus arcularius HHB13444]|uniref:Uncharacterized protein n=1 Tax=Polyporus arcularius HHB13444 TaxID=1314778 RepID=A0A5C3PSC1_9APHY|nr:hypothetical protein K466DRAFT_200392 [Polyporus arcularius HHB13444]